jgi:hypothetical protein
MKITALFLLISLSCTSCNYESIDEPQEETDSDCEYEDGTHSATVDYYNPETGHNAEYDLEVEVQDCEVIQINFPKGGWLDSDHISPTALDENGNATIEDDQGRTWEIHLN